MLNNNRILNYQMTYLSVSFEWKTSKTAWGKSIIEHSLLLVLSVGHPERVVGLVERGRTVS
jgi:hypothetical protein